MAYSRGDYTKTIYFFKDGDHSSPPVKIIINPKKYRNIESILDELTEKMPGMPYGVRSIFTPTGNHTVRTVGELSPDIYYVASTNLNHPKGLDPAALQRRRHWSTAARPFSNKFRAFSQAEILSPLPQSSPRKLAFADVDRLKAISDSEGIEDIRFPNTAIGFQSRAAKKITVIRNGDPLDRHLYVISKRFTHSLEQVLTDLSDLFRVPVKKLFTIYGGEVTGLAGLFHGPHVFVASSQSRFLPSYNLPSDFEPQFDESLFKKPISEPLPPVVYLSKRERLSRTKGKWLVWITTSSLPSAGTTAAVFITVYGHRGNSGNINLSASSGRRCFSSGHTDQFDISLGNVGEIYKIRIGHDNTGSHPSWFCEQVRTRDKHSGEELIFNCQRWLSRDEEDGEVCRELPALRLGEPVLPIKKYDVYIVTGDIWQASTTATVYLTIYGERGDTGVRQLYSQRPRKSFQQAQTDVFSVEAVDLGKIDKVVIGHDGAGPSSGWFLERLLIKERDSSSEYLFPCHRWLDENEDDGQIVRVLIVQDKPVPVAAASTERDLWDVERWKFDAKNEVVLFSTASQMSLRIDTVGVVDALGSSSDPLSVLRVSIRLGNVRVFASSINEKLHLGCDGRNILGLERSGAYSEFKIRVKPDRTVRLESVKYPGVFISVSANGQIDDVRAPVSSGCDFICYCKGILRDQGVVMFYTSLSQTLSIDQDGGGLTSTGKRNKLAHFRVHKVSDGRIRKFESIIFPNQFLQISHNMCNAKGTGDELSYVKVGNIRPGGYIQLESLQHPGLYVGVNPSGAVICTPSIHDHRTRFYLEVIEFGIPKQYHSPRVLPPPRQRSIIHEPPQSKAPAASNRYFVPPVPIPKPDSPLPPSPPLPEPQPEKPVKSTQPSKRRLPTKVDDLPVFSSPEDSNILDGDWKVIINSVTMAIGADVALIVYGNAGNSGPIVLGNSQSMEYFMPGNSDDFKINLAGLGPLIKIRLELLPLQSNFNCSWKVLDLKLRDVHTNELLKFYFNRWLSRNHDDGEIMRELPVIRPGRDVLPVLNYVLETKTGNLPGSDTEANVFVNMFGDLGDCGKRLLQSDTKKFALGQTDKFSVEAVYLGQLKHCVVEHDGQGPGEGWYLEYIKVAEGSNPGALEYICKCERWFETSIGDGRIARKLPLKINTPAPAPILAEAPYEPPLEIIEDVQPLQAALPPISPVVHSPEPPQPQPILKPPRRVVSALTQYTPPPDLLTRNAWTQSDDPLVTDFGTQFELRLRSAFTQHRQESGHFRSTSAQAVQSVDSMWTQADVIPTETRDEAIQHQILQRSVSAMAEEKPPEVVSSACQAEFTIERIVSAPKVKTKTRSTQHELTFRSISTLAIEEAMESVVASTQADGVETKAEGTQHEVELRTISALAVQEMRNRTVQCDIGLPEQPLPIKESPEPVAISNACVQTWEPELKPFATQVELVFEDFTVNTSPVPQAGDWLISIQSGDTVNKIAWAEIHVYGEHATFGPYTLQAEPLSNHSSPFTPKNCDQFPVTLGLNLGQLYKMRIGHGDEEDASWFIETITLTNLYDRNEEYHIEAQQFLSRYHGDKAIYREYPIGPYYHNIQCYSIEVFTGSYPNAATSSPTYANLIGQRGDSGSRYLYQSLNNETMFCSNQMDQFEIRAVDLGELKQIIIGIADRSPGNGWYCEKVVVKETLNDESVKETYFPCNRWLDVDKDDGEIERILEPGIPIVPKSPTPPPPKSPTPPPPEPIPEKEPTPVKEATPTPEPQYPPGTMDISVKTPPESGPTNSRVYLAIYGETKKCGPFMLRRPDGATPFQPDSEDVFRIIAKDTGKLQKIRVGALRNHWWDWFLGEIRLLDLNTNEEYQFVFNRWLSRQKDDNDIVREMSLCINGTPSKEVIKYSVKIFIGNRWGAESDCDLLIRVHGEHLDSGKRILFHNDETMPLYHKNKAYEYQMECVDLGALNKVEIFYRGVGSGSGTFIDHIEVSTKSRSYLFHFGKWLDSREQDQKGVLIGKPVDVLPKATEELWYVIRLVNGSIAKLALDAVVSLKLIGKESSSEKRFLDNPLNTQKAFIAKQQDYFFIKSARIEEIQSVDISIESSAGGSNVWMLDYIAVMESEHAVFEQIFPFFQFIKGVKQTHNLPYQETRLIDQTLPDFNSRVPRGSPTRAWRIWLSVDRIISTADSEPLDDVSVLLIMTVYGTKSFADDIKICSNGVYDYLLPSKEVSELYIFSDKLAALGDIVKFSLQAQFKDIACRICLNGIRLKVGGTNQEFHYVPSRGEAWLNCEKELKQSLQFPAIQPDAKPRNFSQYDITVETADYPGASTPSPVFVQLFGSFGTTGRVKLCNWTSGSPPFRRGQKDSFVFHFLDIGVITSCILSVDAPSRGRGFRCESISVTDQQRKTLHFFPCDRWLDVGCDDRAIETTLRPLLNLPLDSNPSQKPTTENGEAWTLVVTTFTKWESRSFPKVKFPGEFTLFACTAPDFISAAVTVKPTGNSWIFDKEYSYEVIAKVTTLRKLRLIAQGVDGEYLFPFKKITLTNNDSARSYSFSGGSLSGIRYFDTVLEVPLIATLKPLNLSCFTVCTYSLTLTFSDDIEATIDFLANIIGTAGDTGTRRLVRSDGSTDRALKCSISAINVGLVQSIRLTKLPSKPVHLVSAYVIDGKYAPTETVFNYNKPIGTKLKIDEPVEVSVTNPTLNLHNVADDIEEFPWIKKTGRDWKLKLKTFEQPSPPLKGPVEHLYVTLCGFKSESEPIMLDARSFQPETEEEFNVTTEFEIDDLVKVRLQLRDSSISVLNLKFSFIGLYELDEDGAFFENDVSSCLIVDNENDGQVEISLGAPAITILPETTYEIGVHTLNKKDAFTSANVHVAVSGLAGKSGRHRLKRSQNVSKFLRGRVDRFELSCLNLMDITQLTIDHDGKQPGQGWGLSKVTVKALPKLGISNPFLKSKGAKREREYVFLCGQWLDTGKGDGRIERKLKPLTVAEAKEKSMTWIALFDVTELTQKGSELTELLAVIYGEKDRTKETRLKSLSGPFLPERKKLSMFSTQNDPGDLYKVRLAIPDDSKFYGSFLCKEVIINHLERGAAANQKAMLEQADVGDDGDTTKRRYRFVMDRPICRTPSINESKELVLKSSKTEVLRYNIFVYTGDEPNAETNADVFITMFGSQGDSGKRALTKSLWNEQKFQRNQLDLFEIDTVDVENLESLIIEHGLSAKSPWFLDSITIRRTADSPKEWRFDCKRWLGYGSTGDPAELELSISEELPKQNDWRVSVLTSDDSHAVSEVDECEVIAFGSKGQSDPLKLSKKGMIPFKKGTICDFSTIIDSKSVGQLHWIQFSHNLKQTDKGFKVSKVTLHDLNKDKRFNFLVSNGRWLDAGKSPFDIVCHIPIHWPDKPEKEQIPVNTYEIEISSGKSFVCNKPEQREVYICIYGEKFNSGKRWLLQNKEKREMFVQNKIDTFVINSVDLGKITRLCIGHTFKDPSGWFIEKAVIQDSQHVNWYTFKCNSWLDSSQEDSAIERDYTPEPNEGGVVETDRGPSLH